jgi:hypothetical protein
MDKIVIAEGRFLRLIRDLEERRRLNLERSRISAGALFGMTTFARRNGCQ